MRYALSIAAACGFACAALLPQSTLAAQSDVSGYPVRPVRVIVAQSPGSSIDTMSRVVFSKMGELLGQQFVIENRTGAGGVIGGGIVAHAEADGYTLLAAATASLHRAQRLRRKVLGDLRGIVLGDSARTTSSRQGARWQRARWWRRWAWASPESPRRRAPPPRRQWRSPTWIARCARSSTAR